MGLAQLKVEPIFTEDKYPAFERARATPVNSTYSGSLKNVFISAVVILPVVPA